MESTIGSFANALLFEGALKGGAVLLLAVTVLALLRRRPAAGRHLVLAIAAVALLTLPPLVAAGPEWSVAVLPEEPSANPPPAPESVAAIPPASAPATVAATLPSPNFEPDPDAAATPGVPESAGEATAPVSEDARFGSPGGWLGWLWIAGALLFLAPLPAGWIAVARLRRGARDLDRADLVREVADRLGLRRRVTVLLSPRATVPLVAGIVRSIVLLPREAACWAEAKLRIVLLHELAHVRRWDVLSHSIGRLAAALHWFNPLAWPLLRRLRIESEKACDDAVLSAGSNPAEYSSVLLDVARAARVLVAAAMPMARGAGFEGRLRAILDDSRPRRAPGRAAPLLAASLALLALVALAGIRPTAVLAEESSSSDVLTVGKDGSAEYESIQAAVDAAPDGATIRVAPGTYEERVRIEKPLTLMGAGWTKTRIVAPLESVKDFQARAAEIQRLLAAADTDEKKLAIIMTRGMDAYPKPTLALIGAKGVRIEGIRVDLTGQHRQGVSKLGYAIGMVGSKATLDAVAVIGSPASGIGVADACDVVIENSLVAAVWSTGIEIRGFVVSPKVRIVNCDVRNGHHRCITIGRGCDDVVIQGCRISGSDWHGIRYDGCGPTIRGNRIEKNVRCGIYASGGTSGTIEGNLFLENGMTGISFWFQGTDRVRGNTFVRNERSGLEIIGATEPKVEANVFYANPTGVGLGHTSGARGRCPGTAHLVRNVFWRNRSDAMKPGDGRLVPLELAPTAGNRVEDPGFENVQNGVFRLAKDSKCRRDGIGAAAPLDGASPFPVQPEETAMDEERAPDRVRPAKRHVDADGKPARTPHQIARPWTEAITQIKSREKREDAVTWMQGAPANADPVLRHAGLIVFTQSGQVKYDRTGFPELIWPLVTKLEGPAQVSAFYALNQAGLEEGDLPLLLAAARRASPELLRSASHLIHMYMKGGVSGEAADVIMVLLGHENRRVIKDVLRGLWGARTTPSIQNRMVELLETADGWDDKHSVIYFGLSTCANKTEPVVRALVDVLGDPNPNDWERALWGLGWGVPKENHGVAADGLLAMFGARNSAHIQSRCLKILGTYGQNRHLDALRKAAAEGELLPDAIKNALASAIGAIERRME